MAFSNSPHHVALALAVVVVLSTIPSSECVGIAVNEQGPAKDRRFCSRMQDAEQIRIIADKVGSHEDDSLGS
jgi:hypothetical protein